MKCPLMLSRWARVQQLRNQFATVHRRGMASLRAHDYAGFGLAVKREREIADEFIALCAMRPPIKASTQSGSIPPN